ncbi:MAG: hypothetical protein JNJ75_17350 [Cyclobacteriaceae bacterium]|nr:hypothetical protein [Cyclobacteriaceae bacterium]
MHYMLSRIISLSVFIAVFLISHASICQELFILNEPASSVPKSVFGLRIYHHAYDELDTKRKLFAIRAMYGVTSRLSLFVNTSVSNHHDKKLPPDLINHTHTGNQTNYFTSTIKRGRKYPYLFTGMNVFAKYRFLSLDKKYEHFRMAGYSEWSNANVAHDEAEPNLMDDTAGFGFGIISTYLKNRFAISLNTGYIVPQSYTEDQPDFSGGPNLPTIIHYGKAIKYNISIGYRLFPRKYENNYKHVNTNIYLEFTGKTVDAARVIQAGTEIAPRTAALKRSNYIEVSPGLQRIFNSNLRVEVCFTYPLLKGSFAHFTPAFTLAMQRYFYRKTKKSSKDK